MPDLLQEYRQLDVKNNLGEITAENETLNPIRLRRYLETSGVTSANFKEKFNVATAINFLSIRPTSGEKEMSNVINQANSYLTTIGASGAIEKTDKAAFLAQVNAECFKRNIKDKNGDLLKGYESYQLIRNLAEKSLQFKEYFTQERDKQKQNFSRGIVDKTGETVDTAISKAGDIWDSIRANFTDMSTSEKAFLIGGGVLATWFISSESGDNKTWKTIKDKLFGVLKIGGLTVGGGLMANTVYKLFTGKSGVDAISDYVSSTTGKADFFQNAFETSKENAGILQKCVVFLGNQDFLDLAQRYREAKAANKKTIAISSVNGISEEEIFQGLSVFFNKYPVEKLETKYRNFKPRPTFAETASVEMAEDKTIKFEGTILDRAAKEIENKASTSWNWLIYGEGFNVTRSLYKKVHGIVPTDDEVRNWALLQARVKDDIDKETQLEDYINKREFSNDLKSAYKDIIKQGTTDSKFTNVKYVKINNTIYGICKESIINLATDQNALGNAMTSSVDHANTFVKERFGINTELPNSKKVSIDAGLRIRDNAQYLLLFRIPA